jgi:hypothetical protein
VPLHTSPDDSDAAIAPLVNAYVRYRRVLLALVVGFVLLGFNGQWIVERDTALYRGLGHALASGEGYRFGEFASRVVYPGLPLILAGLELLFGETALPAIILINLMALATLWMTYRLIALYFPEWIAVAVTAGVGLNARFASMAQEIMTDIPFLLGVVLFLYGWERLKLALRGQNEGQKAEGRGQNNTDSSAALASSDSAFCLLPSALRALAYLVPGLLLALSMRPTFWILAVAWGLVCLWGLYRGPRRFYATCIGLVLVAAVVWAIFDPRTRGFNPLGGGYESHFVQRIGAAGSTLAANLPELIDRQLSSAFFNGRFGTGITQVISLALLGATYFLFRRGLVLWGLLIWCTVLVTLLVQVVPRYYLMVLPLMMLAYVLMWRALAQAEGRRVGPWRGSGVFVAGVVLLVVPNVVRGSKFIYLQHYKDPGGRIEWARSIAAADLIKDVTPQDARVVAPGAPIVRYLSGRNVYMGREIFPAHVDPIHYPRLLARKNIEYAFFPSDKIRSSEPVIADLIDRGVIVPTSVLARGELMTLATIEVVVPPEGRDWRDNPVKDYASLTTKRVQPTTSALRRLARLRREANEARERRERNELNAKLEARRKREAQLAREARERQERVAANKVRIARERQAAIARRKRMEQQSATQPATQPAPAPASQPTSMRWPHDRTSGGVENPALLRSVAVCNFEATWPTSWWWTTTPTPAKRCAGSLPVPATRLPGLPTAARHWPPSSPAPPTSSCSTC